MHNPIPAVDSGCPKCGGSFVDIHYGEYVACDTCDWSNCGIGHWSDC